jgi:hypothetical protein
MAEDHSELLQNFMAITGLDDTAQAISVLEATNYNLEAAVNLHFATGEGMGDAGAPAQNASAGAGDPPPLLDDEVRAPLPTRTERLFGDHMGLMAPGTR